MKTSEFQDNQIGNVSINRECFTKLLLALVPIQREVGRSFVRLIKVRQPYICGSVGWMTVSLELSMPSLQFKKGALGVKITYQVGGKKLEKRDESWRV